MANTNPQQVINLFEFSNKEKYSGDVSELKSFLNEIWENYQKEKSENQFHSEEEEFDEDVRKTQKFITFLDEDKIKSKNFIGFIRYNNQTINLLPKIFFDKSKNNHSEEEIRVINANILWWLSYCSKFKFPKSKSNLNYLKSDFFEVFIYLFADYTRKLLEKVIYQSYEEVGSELNFMKGRLDVSAYIPENISKARWHKLSCVYDSFEFDNQFNRIIKFVCRLLSGASVDSENKKRLQEIIFILDEVSDVHVTVNDCEKVKLNPLFEDMITVLDYCRLFLANSISYSYKNDFKVFAFLLPTEYVFEDFVYGFIKENFKDLNIEPKEEYLTKDKTFKIRPDIYLKIKNIPIIIDMKYKLTYGRKDGECDKKYGVSQPDIYQMISYAIRIKVENVFLFYPETINYSEDSKQREPIDKTFEVKDEFSGTIINIHIAHLPIIKKDFPTLDSNKSLEENFKNTKEYLITKLKNIFGSINPNE
ncbi:MAG: hypothetical protein CVU81_01070 [Euryarchaeota archaeon HGW-Euryarchaeota-1]|nr:MAG: hypothetical protein CVU81_01070 [Euryarchaeota archaeon HGW-Euryarchaeota-1]